MCGPLSMLAIVMMAQEVLSGGGLTAPGGGGAVGSHRGRGRGGGGFGYVSQWPAGFFIAGSSIHNLNG